MKQLPATSLMGSLSNLPATINAANYIMLAMWSQIYVLLVLDLQDIIFEHCQG
jgi:hypothetical protein